MSACAAIAEPLHDQDNGGLPGVYHFPDSTDGAILAPGGTLSMSFSANTSSHSIVASSGNESLFLDGETSRIELDLRYGIGARLEVGIEVPYLWHESGGLDNFIDTWHDVFGLPVGDRPSQPDDQLRIAYDDASGSRIDFDRNTNGIGDIRLIAGWRLREGPTHKTALRFGVSLPSGDSALLLGSGAATFSLGFSGAVREVGRSGRINGYYSLQAIYIGKPDLLADRYRKTIGQFSAGVGFGVTPAFELNVQAIVRSALYDSRIDILGEPSVTLSIGGNIDLTDRVTLSLSVTEDIKVESAPDVAFQIALRYRPGF